MRIQLPESRRRRRLALVAIAVAIAAGYYLLTRLVPHSGLHRLLRELSDTLGPWTYLLVGVFAFAEVGAFVGLLVPGETVMLLGGAVAGQGAVNVYLLIAIAWFSAWAGDTASFFVGRRLGREFLLRHGPRFGLSENRFAQVEDYFSRHGGKTIFIGRFVSLVRAFAPFIAGSSGMRYRAFVPYSILGCGLFVAAHILIGYVFSRSIDTAAKYAGRGAFLLGTLIVVVVAAIVLVRRFRVEENRRAAVRWMERHAVARWLVAFARRFQPQLRFLWERVTPGGTFGLEFTSLMAILAVSGFVLVGYAAVVSAEPGPTPGDVTAREIAEGIRAAWLTGFVKAFTALGSAAVVWPLALACGAALALRRRWAEVCVLAAGMLLIVFGVHEVKDAVARPRPGDGLVAASGFSFPSGHTAYSTFYVWLAVTTAVRLRPGMARGAAAIAAGIALSALIGFSRVYLGVHYMSDVNGGWALGGAAFSLCAAVALVISTLRHNGLDGTAAGAAEDRT
ncbi:MAG TPA: bifunctional DedA family/phosphatase PAP2 family protein [Solirubrobacterales bacterium]|nr:bifunctional DedA family/phosphatase PAP2 family protein [Solirubrobacterales bacterium]